MCCPVFFFFSLHFFSVLFFLSFFFLRVFFLFCSFFLGFFLFFCLFLFFPAFSKFFIRLNAYSFGRLFVAYKTPKEIEQYRQKFLFGKTQSEAAIFLGAFTAGFITAYAYSFSFASVLAGAGIALFGYLWVFHDFGKRLLDLHAYQSSVKKANFTDLSSAKFLGVKDVRDDAIFLNDNSLVSLIQVIPLDFDVLEPERKQAIIANYKKFLDGLDYPIEIVCRTVDLNLEEYFKAHRRSTEALNNPALLKRFEKLEKFLRGYIKENEVKDRVFIVALSERMRPLSSAAKFDKRIEQEVFAEARKSLDVKTETTLNALKQCMLQCRRLKSSELVAMLSSIFTGSVNVSEDYLFPITDCNGEK